MRWAERQPDASIFILNVILKKKGGEKDGSNDCVGICEKGIRSYDAGIEGPAQG